MKWDRIPDRWEVAPYSGNGNVGFLFYQHKDDSKNTISINAGRHDYYDHRLPHNGNELLWIYRSRLPLGRFQMSSKGEITAVDLSLSLWDAELSGTVTTTKGSYKIKAFTHSTEDVLHFEIDAQNEEVEISWYAEEPMPPVRKTLDAGGGPKGAHWQKMRDAPLPMPAKAVYGQDGKYKYCYQELYQKRGETTTAWTIEGNPAAKQVFQASIHHSFPENNSKQLAITNLVSAEELKKKGRFLSSHRAWWHNYYPESYVSLNDAEKEAFYWIQMYKLGSAMRENGPILDLMGPWYNHTFWPMVWGDLNVQLQYWTPLTSNRLSLGDSLPNNIDKYANNLVKNVPKHWKDSASISTCFPQDLLGHGSHKVPDMLTWVLHNYWLQCEYAGDSERMRDGLFPILKKTVNSYYNFMKDRPSKIKDGKIHISYSWSPEYPGGTGEDINYTIALLRWACETLIAINDEHDLNDSMRVKWKSTVDNLTGFQIDENGLRIGRDIAFDKPHRHYSHLLAFYPLALITPEKSEDAKMLRKSLDHWLDVTINSGIKVNAMPVTGYTATGAASMYACLGDAEKAYYYLDFLIKHKNVSTTTMYAEGNPVIESPLSFATALHDMLLQSWGGKIRVFRGSPKLWKDVSFHKFRTQGAFLVSAKKNNGKTQFVRLESLKGKPCFIKTDINKPYLYINGQRVSDEKLLSLVDGMYEIDLKQGEVLLMTGAPLNEIDLNIETKKRPYDQQHLFGLSDKTLRLPGHKFYYKK